MGRLLRTARATRSGASTGWYIFEKAHSHPISLPLSVLHPVTGDNLTPTRGQSGNLSRTSYVRSGASISQYPILGSYFSSSAITLFQLLKSFLCTYPVPCHKLLDQPLSDLVSYKQVGFTGYRSTVGWQLLTWDS